MWQRVAKFKGAEYFRKALYVHNKVLLYLLNSTINKAGPTGPSFVDVECEVIFLTPFLIILYVSLAHSI